MATRGSILLASFIGPAILFALAGSMLLEVGRADFPQLHTILDTGACLLSAVLVYALWNQSDRKSENLFQWLALSFAFTSALELVHVLVTVEWSGPFGGIARSVGWLRPSTWPPAALVLPIGVACSIWLGGRTRPDILRITSGLLVLSVALLGLFYSLPRYAEPGLFGISRPTLILVPPLWAVVALACLRRRSLHPIFPALTLAAALLFFANAAMLYSQGPHDTPAMVAHLGKLCGYLTVLLKLMQMASQDISKRLRAEQALAAVNATLEWNVQERTEELRSANTALEAEIANRRTAEHELAESHMRMRAVVETALDGVITMDDSGRIREFNQAAERIFGHERAAMIGQRIDETIVPFELRAAHQRGLTRYLDSGQSTVLGKRVELTGLRADGSTVAIELSINRMPGNGPPLFAAFLRDITERRHSIEALRESQSRYQMLAESMPNLVWTCLPDGQCDYLSRQWVEYTGRPEAEQLGYGWADQLHPDDREHAQASWTQAILRSEVFDVEFRIRRGDGEFRWFKTRAVPVRDATGTVVKWFGSSTDFEDLKRIEEKLRAQVARLNLLDQTTRAIGDRQDLRSIFQVVLGSLEDNLPIDFGCVCLTESDQKSLTVTCVGAANKLLAHRLAITERDKIEIDENGLARCMRGELVYEPDTSIYPFPFPARLARSGLSSVVIAPLIVEQRVFGVMIVARCSAASFTSGECEFIRQLTQHVALAANQAQLYLALQNAYEDLRQTQEAAMQHERLRALGQMAAGIAHDINNALSPAALYAQFLLERDSSLSEETRSHLAVIQRAIDDVANTVARMREFYRPRERELTLAPVALNDVLAQVVDLTRARWSDMPLERGVVIRVDTDFAEDLPTISGAESEIRDAVTNLVLNAIDAMPDGGAITLRSRSVPAHAETPSARSATHVQIDVRDTGAGMSEKTRSRCLEPFFTTKGERGTGLGLAMVYGMVQRHSAELEVLSELGTGTTMRLTFPVSVIAGTPRIQERRLPEKPLRLLLVDDDPLLLKSLREVIEQDGHIVTIADGGQAGLDAFSVAEQSNERFDVVITDLGMPYVDGRSVAAGIKSQSPATPVILLTGWGHRLIVDQEIPANVDRVLSKPPRLVELREALAEMTDASHPASVAADST